jgi:hypothetical protein
MRTSDGAAVGIRGEFGSGKTHLIWQLMSHAVAVCALKESDEAEKSGAPAIQPVQVYAKAVSSDFMEVYRSLLGYLGARQMTRAHIGVLNTAARQLASKQDGIGAATADVLNEHPERIIHLLRDTLLSESEVVATASSALQGEKSRYADFFSAFTFLNDPRLQDAAFKWFSGESLDAQTRDRLGVSGPITEANVVVALQFLSLMFAFAGIPLLVYIDQIERLNSAFP